MTPAELTAIRERWAKRESDPRFNYQSGCAGSPARNGAMHRGPCGEGMHHHHDERCAPSPSEDVLALLAEIDRLRPKAEAWERLESDLKLMAEIAGEIPPLSRTPAMTEQEWRESRPRWSEYRKWQYGTALVGMERLSYENWMMLFHPTEILLPSDGIALPAEIQALEQCIERLEAQKPAPRDEPEE